MKRQSSLFFFSLIASLSVQAPEPIQPIVAHKASDQAKVELGKKL
jgi:hypothetical protein